MFSVQTCPQVERVSQQLIFKVTDFTESSLQSFEKCLSRAMENGQPILPLYIQSDGGSAAILYGFLSNMKSYREKGLKFAAVVSGTASSAGCCVYLYSDYRFMGEFASLLYHSLQLNFINPLPNAVSELNWNIQESKKMNEALSRHLKKPKDWLEKQLKKNGVDDWNIDPETALKLGLADEIKIPQFNLQISAQYSIT